MTPFDCNSFLFAVSPFRLLALPLPELESEAQSRRRPPPPREREPHQVRPALPVQIAGRLGALEPATRSTRDHLSGRALV